MNTGEITDAMKRAGAAVHDKTYTSVLARICHIYRDMRALEPVPEVTDEAIWQARVAFAAEFSKPGSWEKEAIAAAIHAALSVIHGAAPEPVITVPKIERRFIDRRNERILQI